MQKSSKSVICLQPSKALLSKLSQEKTENFPSGNQPQKVWSNFVVLKFPFLFFV